MKRLRNHIKITVFFLLSAGFVSCHTSNRIHDIEKRELGSYQGNETIVGAEVRFHWQNVVINEAMTWIGTPYKYGGAEKGEGTDCSGMVLRVYEKCMNWKLPRVSSQQADYCRKIRRSEIKAGDLVFFATTSDPQRVTHVGIVVDNETFIHSSSSKGVVLTKFSSPYFSKRLIMFGRLPQVTEKLRNN